MNWEKFDEKRVNELFNEITEEIEFKQDWENYKKGKSDISVQLPIYAEIKNLLIKETSPKQSKPLDIFQQHYEELQAWFQIWFGNVQMADTKDLNKVIEVRWNGKPVSLSFWKIERGIEVYTSNPDLIGKFLVIKEPNGKFEYKSKFFRDDTTAGMEASAFFELSKDFSFDENLALQIEIEE